MPRLIESNSASPRAFELEGILIAGRASENPLCLDDPSVSARHARFSATGTRVFLEDLNSERGVRVNGKPVQRCELRDGDRILIGTLEFTYQDRSAAPEPGALPFESVGAFRLKAYLGKDNMGETYSAVHAATRQAAAVKLLSPGFSADPEFKAHFLEQLGRARQLNHPLLAPFLDHGEESGRLYFATELVEGETLEEGIRKNGSLNGLQALELAITLCEGLGQIHAQGLVHQDIRPRNIIFDAQGNLKLVGLGMANLVRRERRGQLPTVILGDPYYMAPEQMTGGVIDGRSDFYALGTTLFYVLTSRPPFEGPLLVVLTRHKVENRPNASRFDVTIPQHLSKYLMRLMGVAQADRPPDVQAVRAELEQLKAKLLEYETANQTGQIRRSAVFRKGEISDRLTAQSRSSRIVKRPNLRRQTQELPDFRVLEVDAEGGAVRSLGGLLKTVAAIAVFLGLSWLLYLHWNGPGDVQEGTAKVQVPAPLGKPEKPGAKSGSGVDKPATGEAPSAGKSATAAQEREALQDLLRRTAAPVSKDGREELAQFCKYFEEHTQRQKEEAVKELVAHPEESLKILPRAIAQATPAALSWLADASRKLKHPKLAAPLLQRALLEKEKAGYPVFHAIGALGADACYRFLRPLLGAPNPRLGDLAWMGFAQCPRPEDLDLICQVLEGAPGTRQMAAAQALARLSGMLEDKSRIKERIKSRIAEEGPGRLAYAQALSLMDPVAFEDLLSNLMLSENALVRRHSIQALGRHKDTVQYVLAALGEEKNPAVQESCLQVLREYPNFAAVEAVLKIFERSRGQVSVLSQQALVAAFGKDLGPHSAAWRAWLSGGEKDRDPGRQLAFLMAQEKRAQAAAKLEAQQQADLPREP